MSTTSTLNISWLDEELRKEKALSAELRDKVDKQQIMLADQAQRILALEDRLGKLQAQLSRIPEVEEGLRNTRDGVSLQLAEIRQDQQKREAEFLRNRRAEREQDLRAIQALEAELRRFDPLEQSMAVRQAEERRLTDTLVRLQAELASYVKRLNQREEAERQLADRIERNAARFPNLEKGLAELQKAQQEQLERILLVETALPKLEQPVKEMLALRDELTEQQREFAESQRLVDRDRAQMLTEWSRRLETYAHQLDVWGDQLRYFADQHEKNRRVLRDVQELTQQVSQQQDQLRQLQRIAEEQIRREFREWRSENDRRWIQENERWQKAWEAQTVRDDDQDRRTANLEELRKDDLAAMAMIRERISAIYSELTKDLDVLRRAQLHAVQTQSKAFADVTAELRGLLEKTEPEEK